MKLPFFAAGLLAALSVAAAPESKSGSFSRADYLDRIEAAWTGQIIACLMGFQFEHKVASVQWVDQYPRRIDGAIVDDDWYYEMCALRAFEKHGIKLTVEQLGEQWKENSCGSWGSSEQARLNLDKGIKAPDSGHPRYNKLWFTIGPQFSAELYGLFAPGMPNLAGHLAREYGHVNGYAEGTDGAVFVAGMVSLAFVEKDPRVIVRKAAELLHPDSPHRQMLESIMAMAGRNKTSAEIFDAIEDRWRTDYPANNNAVPNAGIVAAGLWFGEGDFLKTLNLIYRAADYTDADCNGANAAAVIAVMHGRQCLPRQLVEPLKDRISGDTMGRVKLTPPVDEKISDLSRRTAVIGEKFIAANGGSVAGENIAVPVQEPRTQPAELFSPNDLTKFWNPDWTLERAGCGGAAGALGSIRGITHLDGDILATWPRDVVRGVVLRRKLKLGGDKPSLTLKAGVDTGRAWGLEIYVNNRRMTKRLLDGGPVHTGERKWQDVQVNLGDFAGQEVELRLYQLVLMNDKIAGNAYWKDLKVR